jgi:thiol:disulfide interchange protein
MKPPIPLFRPLMVLAALLLGLLASAAPAAAQDEVTVTVKAQKQAVAAGERLAIAIIFDHQEGWHIHTNDPAPPPGIPKEMLIATQVVPSASELVLYRPIQWPAPKTEIVNLGMGPAEYRVFGGRAIAYLPVEISPAAEPGTEIPIALKIIYQACDDTSCLPDEEVMERIVLRVIDPAAASTPPTAPLPADFAGFDLAAFERDPVPADSPVLQGVGPTAPKGRGIDLAAFNLAINVDPRSALGTLVLLLVGFVGGFLLNLTPCVLPVIPIKIMGLSQAAGNPARCLLLGLVMSLGVLAFWLAIGVAIAGFAILGSAAELFGIWWFTLLLGLFIGVMGLGMMGMFNFTLPQAVYRVNPKHDTLGGSFLFGIMTAVLGLPCFAPFMGGATGVALAVSPQVAIATFGAIGAGMAFPYLLLSARPRWIEVIPRTGPASELIKQIMGLLLLAAAAFFVGNGILALISEPSYTARVLHWYAVALPVIVAGGWLALRTIQITRSTGRRAVFGGIGATLAAVGVLVAVGFTMIYREGAWIRYTPERFQEAQAAGKVIVVDFTADWCLNCHTLKLVVLSRRDVKRALEAEDVVALTADLSSREDPGWQFLHDLGQRGIPLLAIFGPGSGGYDEPFKSNAYTADQVIGAIDQARGPRPHAAAGPAAEPQPLLPAFDPR